MSGIGHCREKLISWPFDIEDCERAQIGHAAGLVAQLDMHVVAPVFIRDYFAADGRKAGQIVLEAVLHGLHRGEGLLDLLGNDKRGI